MRSLQGRIAVIGWGSLIWDLDDLAPKIEGDWLMEVGPALPFEFSTVSKKRKMGLAVCIDPVNGSRCATNAILSIRDEVDAAAEDLRERERLPDVSFVGAVCRASGRRRAHLPQVAEALADWCGAVGAAGAVWTDSASNYDRMRGEAFSVPGAVAYLKTLRGESLDEAVRYIELAPKTTATPLRRALSKDGWWRREARRVVGGGVSGS